MPLCSEPVLALETSAGASACLLLPNGKSLTTQMTTPRAHSRELLPMLQELLKKADLTWQDIGAFAVGVGPGSFTGLRVACATIAGINASLEKPVYSLCSLGILARQADIDTSLWAIEDARSNLVYAAKFKQGKVIKAASCMSWDMFSEQDPSSYIAVSGIPCELNGWNVLPLKLSREQALVEAVKNIQPEEKSSLWVEPVYLQVSQAEKNLE